jgi:hypothetical protein
MSASKERLRRERHVIKRAQERYGMTLTHADVGLINSRLRQGDGLEFGQTEAARNIFLEVKGISIPFVFHVRKNCAVTVLPNGRQVKKGRMVVECRI